MKRLFREFRHAPTFLLLFCCLLAPAAEFPPEQIEFFESKIRPVLAQECYECHNSRDKAKAGLVLDHREGLLRGGDTGPAVVPGRAAESLLLEALRHENDLEMPKAGVKLDPPIIADFERWIAMGAPDPRDEPPTDAQLAEDTDWEAIFQTRKNWWSFQPIRPPEIPAGDGAPIDRFIRVKLEEKNLEPSPPAEARVLARRLHFALTGLPPTPEELDRFESACAGDRKAATTALVDDLLASPHFGERWARHWMDWVRYAESHGSEGDPRIDNAHLYRDYLIRALNGDLPYDRLLREHVAGDLLEKPRFSENGEINESVLGTIHWRMVFHGFAPTDALDEKVRFTDDQINTFTKAFQALTVSCARCHDHKFDAISQADYYALFGVLGSSRPGRKLIDPPAVLERNKGELAAMKPAIRRAVAADWLSSLDRVEEGLLDRDRWKDATKATSIHHPFHLLDKDGKLTPSAALRKMRALGNPAGSAAKPNRSWNLAEGADHGNWYRYGNGLPENPAAPGSILLADSGDRVVERILPGGMYSGLLSTKHAARFTSPDFRLEGKNKLYLLVNGGGRSLVRYVVQNYPRSGTVFKVHRFGGKKDGSRESWQWRAFDLEYWEGDEVHIELATARDTAVLVENENRSWFGIREARLVNKDLPAPPSPGHEFLGALHRIDGTPPPQSIEDLAAIYRETARHCIEAWRDGRAGDADALFLDHLVEAGLLANTLDELQGARPLVTRYRELESEIAIPTRVPGIDEWTGRDQPLFERGNHKKPLEPVSRRFLEAVDASPFETPDGGRLQLAERLLDGANPFTRRVIVNRIWTHLFGNGIVGSVDNFGRLGEKPSHPGLLDFLAVRFSENHDWSLKSLIREIVLSGTWQQSSLGTDRARKLDPENRLLSHFPLERLEAEAIRDKLLAVSGQLEKTMFGPPVSGGNRRRSVYVNVIRNRLDPFLGVFDAPVPFSTTGKRPETNVPAQSLTMLNDAFVLTQARAFAREFGGEDRERIEAMWTRALGRAPAPEEVEASLQFLDRLRGENASVAAERERLRTAITALSGELSSILVPARKRLEKSLEGNTAFDPATSGAIAYWNFAEGGKDLIGGLGGRMEKGARLEGGSLVLDGRSAFFSAPLPAELREKTLEVVVTLDRLDQRAGGAITVQDLNGGLFDSIVFAERREREWMAGSNNFKRTSDFRGPPEKEAHQSAVHIAIVYDADGMIRGYRNGQPYGTAYASSGPALFEKGKSQVVLGLRHGTRSGGNRNLSGTIHRASVYDRALDAGEIASLAAGRQILSRKQILESLSEEARERCREIDVRLDSLEANLAAMEKPGSATSGDDFVWENFAHSLFNLKEFIYVY